MKRSGSSCGCVLTFRHTVSCRIIEYAYVCESCTANAKALFRFSSHQQQERAGASPTSLVIGYRVV